MKHRTHKDFPSYRFYSDGRIMNKTTNHFIKETYEGRSITVQKYNPKLFPNLYAWEDLRGKPTYTPIKVSDRKRRKYNPKFIKALQQEANYKTWDEGL